VAGVEVEPLDDPSAVCTQRVRFTRTYNDHVRPKYGIEKGPGRDSGKVLCAACPTDDEQKAIGRAKARVQRDEEANRLLDEQRKRRSPGEKFWGWATVPIAVVMLLWHVWFLAAVAAVVGLVFFLFVAPLRCRQREPQVNLGPCPEWGHGLLRAHDDEHQHLRNTQLIHLVTERRWPDAWEPRLARWALAGVGVSVLLLLAAGVCYLLTKVF
jgi:hypothetical protein